MSKKNKTRQQSGVIPYRYQGEQIEVMMVTSRRTGEWIFPKGGLEPNMSAAASGAKEALEEAGVKGTVYETSLGHYEYIKHDRLYRVELFPLRVTEQMQHWDEIGQRSRQWYSLKEASQHLERATLRGLLEAFAQRDPSDWE